jgi:hypothetical protein
MNVFFGQSTGKFIPKTGQMNIKEIEDYLCSEQNFQNFNLFSTIHNVTLLI